MSTSLSKVSCAGSQTRQLSQQLCAKSSCVLPCHPLPKQNESRDLLSGALKREASLCHVLHPHLLLFVGRGFSSRCWAGGTCYCSLTDLASLSSSIRSSCRDLFCSEARSFRGFKHRKLLNGIARLGEQGIPTLFLPQL